VDTLYIRTIPKTINWLALTSLGLLFIKVFVFNQIDEIFTGAHELGTVFEGLLGSVLASFVFYLIVIHFKETKDKRVIYPNITRWAHLVVEDCKSQLTAFVNETGVKMSLDDLTSEQIDEAFKKVSPCGNAPLLFSLNNHANWIQYFKYNSTRSKLYISKIMSQLIFLEASFVSLLTSIDDSTHFNIIEHFPTQQIGNKDLSVFSKTFFDYCEACRNLDKYLQNHIGHSRMGTL
jgi:hypothetical protein